MPGENAATARPHPRPRGDARILDDELIAEERHRDMRIPRRLGIVREDGVRFHRVRPRASAYRHTGSGILDREAFDTGKYFTALEPHEGDSLPGAPIVPRAVAFTE